MSKTTHGLYRSRPGAYDGSGRHSNSACDGDPHPPAAGGFCPRTNEDRRPCIAAVSDNTPHATPQVHEKHSCSACARLPYPAAAGGFSSRANGSGHSRIAPVRSDNTPSAMPEGHRGYRRSKERVRPASAAGGFNPTADGSETQHVTGGLCAGHAQCERGESSQPRNASWRRVAPSLVCVAQVGGNCRPDDCAPCGCHDCGRRTC